MKINKLYTNRQFWQGKIVFTIRLFILMVLTFRKIGLTDEVYEMLKASDKYLRNRCEI